MATAIFYQDGKYLDHTPVADVGAGDIILLNKLVGVAVRPIPANTLGALAVVGVFSQAPKATGETWAAGEQLYWDAGNSRFTKTVGSNTAAGKAFASALSGDTTGVIKINV
jgi:predicted RecA/RadA family phage recombinase